MNEKTRLRVLLIGLILLLLVINYPFLNKMTQDFLTDYETGIVERVIDGDTIVVGNESIRLLGINSPEKGEKYYDEAKNFLEILVLNKTVKLEKTKQDKDRYNRKLRYAYIGFTNINLELVKEGLANFYFPAGKDQYYMDFKDTWEECVKGNKNLCEKSLDICARCIVLEEFDSKDQKIVLYNRCEFNCDLTNWTIKDEGRKKFIFDKIKLEPKKRLTIEVGEGNNNNTNLFWENENYVWTSTGDTLFLRDKKNKLVLWESY